MGAAKCTVSDNGSPRRCGSCMTAFSKAAAMTPPNGPTILPYAGCVLPLYCPARSGASAIAASKGCVDGLVIAVGSMVKHQHTPLIAILTHCAVRSGTDRLSWGSQSSSIHGPMEQYTLQQKTFLLL